MLEKYIIGNNSNTNKVSVITRTEYYRNFPAIEPIASCETLEEANNLLDTIKQIGIKTFFDQIIQQTEG